MNIRSQECASVWLDVFRLPSRPLSTCVPLFSAQEAGCANGPPCHWFLGPGGGREDKVRPPFPRRAISPLPAGGLPHVALQLSLRWEGCLSLPGLWAVPVPELSRLHRCPGASRSCASLTPGSLLTSNWAALSSSFSV